MTQRLLPLGLLALFAACGGNDSHAPKVSTEGSGTGGVSRPFQSGGVSGGGTAGTAGVVGGGGNVSVAGASGGDAANPSGGDTGEAGAPPLSARAPQVEILSPAAVSDPDDGEVLVDSDVDVVCKVTASTEPGASPVAPSSVRISIADSTGEHSTELPGAPTNHADEYHAQFVVDTFDNGPVTFRCSATDQSIPGLEGSAEIATFVDRGPTIEPKTPPENSAYPLLGVVPFRFAVSPAPLADGDEKASVDDVSLEVNGVNIDVEEDDDRPGEYTAEVDFNDGRFPKNISGTVPVSIHAENKRSAGRTLDYKFVLDADGPVIKITKPDDTAIVGKEVVLEFTVTDALSGIDKDTVTVKLNSTEHTYGSGTETAFWTHDGDKFTYTFDNSKVDGSVAQVTINVSAADVVGNRSAGASLTVNLDTQAPLVSLDPPNVRLLKIRPNQEDACSESFDPLGARAANDGARVQPAALFRALVWERTNGAQGQKIRYAAGTNLDSVNLYLQPDVEQGLLIDTDGDGTCDDIDAKDLPFQALDAIQPTGDASYVADDSSEAPAYAGTCEYGSEQDPPEPLCTNQSSDLTISIRNTDFADDVEPAVFAKDVVPSTLACTGNTWEIFRSLVTKPGWVCLAARAVDNVGNVGISPPLRVCVVDPALGSDPCSGIPAPACTQDCTPPASNQEFAEHQPLVVYD